MAPTYTNLLHHKVSFSTSVTDVNVKNVSSDRTEPNAHDGVHSLLSIKPIASCIQHGASVYVGAVHKSSSQVSLIHVCCPHSLGCSLSLALSTLSFLCVFSRVYAGSSGRRAEPNCIALNSVLCFGGLVLKNGATSEQAKYTGEHKSGAAAAVHFVG